MESSNYFQHVINFLNFTKFIHLELVYLESSFLLSIWKLSKQDFTKIVHHLFSIRPFGIHLSGNKLVSCNHWSCYHSLQADTFKYSESSQLILMMHSAYTDKNISDHSTGT